MIRPFALTRGYARCRDVTRAHAKSFFLASWALGPARRRGAFAVYAFCRRADDAVDEAVGLDRAALGARVHDLRLALDHVYSFEPLADLELLALRDTVRTYGIERRPFDELIDGVAQDVDKHRYETAEELDRYCYLVAGTVGLLMARLFSVYDDRALTHAIDLGKAMQLTNILRDVREDLFDKGRIYLPADQLRAHRVTEEDLRAPSASPGLRALVRELAGRARALYHSADQGVPMIVSPGGRAATAIMSRTYGEILAVLEARDWDVLAGRAIVPTQRKLALVSRAVPGALRAGARPLDPQVLDG